MRFRILGVAFAAALSLLLASCAKQGPAGDPESLQATLGVFNSGAEQRLLVLLLPPEEQTDAAVEYSITGPDGWNLGVPLKFAVSAEQLTRGMALVVLRAPWVVGEFTIDLELAMPFQARVTMPAAPAVLDPPSNLTLPTASAGAVSAMWDAVPGAANYSAQLQRAADVSTVATADSSETEVTFADLELGPAAYQVQLDAFSFDPNSVGLADSAELPDAGTFSWSRSVSDTLVVAASGSACLPGSTPIADANLSAAIQTALALTTAPDCADLPRISALYVGSADTAPVASLVGLEFAVNLLQLMIERHPFDSLTALAQHPTLQYLNMANSHNLTDIGPLADLPALHTVNLGGSAVTDFSVLASLPQLAALHLNGHGLVSADLAFLADLPDLEALHLNTNDIGSLEHLAGLANLQVLVVSTNPLSNLYPVAGRAFRHLDISDTAVPAADALAFVAALAEPEQLERLGIVGLGISATDLFAAGSNFTSIHSLYMSNNLFTSLPDLTGLRSLEQLLASQNPLSHVSDLEMLIEVFSGRQPDVFSDFAVYLTDNAIDTCDPVVALAAAQLEDLGVVLYMDACVPAP